jgi:hypothetical protein
MGQMRNIYKILIESPKGKIPLWRTRRKWDDNIKMDLKGIGYADVKWIHLAQERVH